MIQTIDSKNDKLIVNGKEIKFPKKRYSHRINQVNNHLYVDGYELVNGKWKRTLKAVLYQLF